MSDVVSLRCWLAACALSSCALVSQVGPVLFTTPCGLQVRGLIPDGGLPPEWTPATVAEAEARTVAALRDTTDPRTRDACKRLHGWNLYPHPERRFVNQAGQTIAGFVNCDKDVIVSGAGDPRTWDVPHELVHAVQRCEPWGHEGWVDAGIYRALDSLGLE